MLPIPSPYVLLIGRLIEDDKKRNDIHYCGVGKGTTMNNILVEVVNGVDGAGMNIN